MKPLVSIITPCYNGEQYIDAYFQSILAQTYTRLELIFVNDGSTDKTEEVALSYREQLEQKGIIFKYICKENGGQASAMNTGFPHMTGEYFIWPDSDDVLHPESIEKRVRFLEENPQLNWVRSDAEIVEYDTQKSLGFFAYPRDKQTKDIYLDLIVDCTYCCCGCYMVRTQTYRKIYPDLHIYAGGQGQNWQIMIPFAANNPCGYIDEPLYTYYVRNNSHSHAQNTLDMKLKRYEGLEEILYQCIQIAPRTDRDYKKVIEEKAVRTRLQLYVEYNDQAKAKKYYRQLKRMRACTMDDKRLYLQKYHPMQFYFAKVWNLCGRAANKLLRMIGVRGK